MSDPARPPSPPWKALSLALFVVIVLAVGGLNFGYLFRTELYEHDDLAANSLAIREAKGFRRLTGQYSRWGFSHPGPGWFYAMGAGEALFHDGLHATPTPWNGQLLAVLLINAAFLAATLGIVAREVAPGAGRDDAAPRALRVAAAGAGLVVAVLGLAALGATAGIVTNWTPYIMVLPFAALVVAAASVGAAGHGGDLPVLTLAGAALLNSHVAQPLFVVPLVGLAWVGLALRHRGRPWRTFPAAHAVALVVVLLAALPVALDAARGADSNLALILAHRRLHPGEAHPWLDALGYHLRLLGGTPLLHGEPFFRGGATGITLWHYVFRHVPIFTAWTVAVVLLIAGAWRSRFGTGLLAGVLLATGLAGYWATKQDGDLLYFNSWFFYGLLLAVGLGAALAAVRAFAAWFPRAARSPWPALGLCALAAGLFAHYAARFRTDWNDSATARSTHRSVGSALADDAANRGRTKYLAFSHDAWGDAVATALDLERRGEPWQVSPEWAVMFGRAHAPAGGLPAGLSSPGGVRVWRVTLRSNDPAATPPRHRLPDGGDLQTEPPALDPAAGGGAGTSLLFSGPHPDADPYLLTGWSSPTAGDPYTWSELPEGRMAFRPVPVPADKAVAVVVDAFPALTPGRVDAQRLELLFNDQPVANWTVTEDAPLRALIPAAAWNARPEAQLRWRFPDAISPRRLGQGDDPREIAFGFRGVTFTLAPGP